MRIIHSKKRLYGDGIFIFLYIEVHNGESDIYIADYWESQRSEYIYIFCFRGSELDPLKYLCSFIDHVFASESC